MELVEAVEKMIDGQSACFLVYKYRMPVGHWAEKDGWLLGLAGPFIPGATPYTGAAGAFSRCGDKYGMIKPAALVDWWMDLNRYPRLDRPPG
jgi:hypothetical protein